MIKGKFRKNHDTKIAVCTYSVLLLVRVRKFLRVMNYGRAAADPSELGFKVLGNMHRGMPHSLEPCPC